MITALWITLIGMGLVFLAILLLWGLMVLLVRLTAEHAPADEQEVPALLENQPGAVPAGMPGQDRKRSAAAAAVSVALALSQRTDSTRFLNPHEPVSPWQAANRAGLIAQRANPHRRKVVR